MSSSNIVLNSFIRANKLEHCITRSSLKIQDFVHCISSLKIQHFDHCITSSGLKILDFEHVLVLVVV